MNKLLISGLFILLICCLSNVHAQTVLYGKVIDNESNEGIPYANVQIVNTALGTACNENGDFILVIFSEYFEDSIKVSCIGYSNAILPIQDLINGFNVNIRIRVNPITQLLDEVKITGIRESPEAFLKEAIDAIPKNYIQQPFNMEFYSKMSVQDSNKVVLYQIESIILTYKEGYVVDAYNISKAMQMRETGTYPPAFQDYIKVKNEYFPYWPGIGITGMDQIGLGYSVFNPKNFKKMQFEYAGVSIFDKDTVVAIDYSYKKKNHATGIVYVASNNLAFIKHSYRIGKQERDIIYKNIDGYYYPYLIKSKIPAIHDNSLFIVDEISLRNVEVDDVVTLKQEHDHWFPRGVPNNEAYWNSNYPIKK